MVLIQPVKIGQGPETKPIPPSLVSMFVNVVGKVTALAPRREIIALIASRIMVQMTASENNIGQSDLV